MLYMESILEALSAVRPVTAGATSLIAAMADEIGLADIIVDAANGTRRDARSRRARPSRWCLDIARTGGPTSSKSSSA